jgi:uncharacterized protein YbjT (DUF2867 family)
MYLEIGGTGMLGSRIVYRLLEQGQPVRAFVRPSSDYKALQEAGAEIALGDLRQPETFAPALRGVERVIATATAPLMERHLPEAVEAVDERGLQGMIDACKQAGVKQFVFTSAYGFAEDQSLPLARAKASSEQYLQNSGLTYTILRLEKFTEVWIGFLVGSQLQNGPTVTIMGDGNTPHSFVSIENVLDLSVGVLGHPAAENAILPLCAPGKYTYREAIGLIGDLIGVPIEVNSIQLGEPFPGMPPFIGDIWSYLERREVSDLDTRHVAGAFGLEMIGVEETLRKLFVQQAESQAT